MIGSRGISLARTVDLLLRPVETALAIFAGAVMALIMVLVSADAILRHLFSAPLSFQFTLTESYLMVAGIALVLPWGYRTGGRIRISLLTTLMPEDMRLKLYRVGNVAAAFYLSVLAWKAGEKTWDAFRNGEYLMGVIDWPVGWSWVWVPIGLGLLTLRLLVDAFGDIETGETGAH